MEKLVCSVRYYVSNITNAEFYYKMFCCVKGGIMICIMPGVAHHMKLVTASQSVRNFDYMPGTRDKFDEH